MIRKLLHGQDGFTLVEALVAALIIVIGMTALAGVLIGAHNEASADVQQNQLINIADRQIEQIRGTVASQGFDALGVMLPSGQTISTFTAQSSATVRNTWFDPEKFVEGGCLEIAGNYDNVSTGGAAPYGTAPSGFTPWNHCNAQAEPLQVFASGGLIQWSGSPISACTTGAGSTITVPCYQGLSSSCLVSGTYAVGAVPACAVTVYAFVTDTWVGCGTSTSGASTASICPTLSSGTVQATPACMTTSVTSSSPCADARRLTVAVVPNVAHTDGQVTPVYLSTVFANPEPSTSQAGAVGLTLGVSL